MLTEAAGGSPREFGRRIRRSRDRQGLTLAQLAERARLSLGYVSLVERGLKVPSPEAGASLAVALGDDEQLYRTWAAALRAGVATSDVTMMRAEYMPSRLDMVSEDAAPESDVVAVRVLPAFADPAEGDVSSAPPLYLDRRFLGAEPGDRLFAYELTAEAAARLGDVAAPGDHVVFSSRVTRLAASRVYAVRDRGRVFPARLGLIGERLVIIPPSGEGSVEVVDTADWRDAVCGVAVVVIRRLLPRRSTAPERRTPSAALSDADLVADLLKGGAGALPEFERRYRPLVAGVLGRMPISDRAEMEQRIWGTLLAEGVPLLHRWRREGSFVPYLARVIRWAFNDQARGSEGGDLAADDTLGALPEGALGPLEILRDREAMKAVERAVSGLAPRDQELLYRRYVFDERNEDIAAALAMGVSTVHVALHRARTRLMARLAGTGGRDVRGLLDRMSRSTPAAD